MTEEIIGMDNRDFTDLLGWNIPFDKPLEGFSTLLVKHYIEKEPNCLRYNLRAVVNGKTITLNVYNTPEIGVYIVTLNVLDDYKGYVRYLSKKAMFETPALGWQFLEKHFPELKELENA